MNYKIIDIVAAIHAAPPACQSADALESHLKARFPGIAEGQIIKACTVALEEKQHEADSVMDQIKAVGRLLEGDTSALSSARSLTEPALWQAAVEAHPDWTSSDGRRFKWKGEGPVPSADSMLEWLHINHPAKAREIERKFERA